MTGTLHEDRYTFLIISRSFLLRMKNVSDKICRENQITHSIVNNIFLGGGGYCFVYVIMWKNIV